MYPFISCTDGNERWTGNVINYVIRNDRMAWNGSLCHVFMHFSVIRVIMNNCYLAMLLFACTKSICGLVDTLLCL